METETAVLLIVVAIVVVVMGLGLWASIWRKRELERLERIKP